MKMMHGPINIGFVGMLAMKDKALLSLVNATHFKVVFTTFYFILKEASNLFLNYQKEAVVSSTCSLELRAT